MKETCDTAPEGRDHIMVCSVRAFFVRLMENPYQKEPNPVELLHQETNAETTQKGKQKKIELAVLLVRCATTSED